LITASNGLSRSRLPKEKTEQKEFEARTEKRIHGGGSRDLLAKDWFQLEKINAVNNEKEGDQN